MRLIDADALMEQIEDVHCKDCDSYNGVKCRACDICIGIDYLEEAPTFDPWHYPSKGEVPNESDIILIAIKEHRKQPAVKIGQLKWMGNFWHSIFHDYAYDEVIAWMPLPEPPKEEA